MGGAKGKAWGATASCALALAAPQEKC